MGCPEGIHKPAAVLHLQRGLHFPGSKRERDRYIRFGNIA